MNINLSKENILNKILLAVGIIFLLITFNSFWSASYDANHFGFTEILKENIWTETLKFAIGLIIICVLAFLKKRISFFVALLYFPNFLGTIYGVVFLTHTWTWNLLYFISNLLAILELIAVILVVVGLYSWYQLWQANKTKAS